MEPLRYKALSQLDELKEAHALKSSVVIALYVKQTTLWSVSHTQMNFKTNHTYLVLEFIFIFFVCVNK